ncbi:MAG: hypothetical protein U9R79_03605, partial [Armatimonadota bacterium]|nr:hypothetical protein [Armatimonadota bacterium]
MAIYSDGLGGQAVAEALAEREDIKPTVLEDLDAEELLGFDALFIGSCSLDRPELLRAIRVFVACGGGVVLNHSACGRHQP